MFDCSRWEFDGDDKAKLQRVEKFYSMWARVSSSRGSLRLRRESSRGTCA